MADYAVEKSVKLREAGFAPSLEWSRRKCISISENNVRYTAEVIGGRDSAAYQIDGCVIAGNELKCDKLVLSVDAAADCGTAVFVELKGRDVAHAIKQLEATLCHPFFRPLPGKKDKGRVRARIVTPGCGPASASRAELEKAKVDFIRKYNCDLRTLKSQQKDGLI